MMLAIFLLLGICCFHFQSVSSFLARNHLNKVVILTDSDRRVTHRRQSYSSFLLTFSTSDGNFQSDRNPHNNFASNIKNDDNICKSLYLATCVPGLAHILQKELYDLQQQYTGSNGENIISNIQLSGNAAVIFEATRKGSLYALCWLRTAHRLLELVANTDDTEQILSTRQDLHDFIRDNVNVKDLLGDGQGGLLTISVKAILNNARQLPKDLSHSHFTALTIKNALCDIVRDLRGDRPNVDVDNPDVPLVAILLGTERNGASLSLYRSLHPPGSLHKRGYRHGDAIHKAAMKESMAAGLLLEAGWNELFDSVLQQPQKNDQSIQKLKLIDPMAGSGSLILEACMMAANIAPGLMRIRCNMDTHKMPPVTRWKSTAIDPDEKDISMLWKDILLDATKQAKEGIQGLRQDPSRIEFVANDIHPGAVEITESALTAAGLLDFVELSNVDCYDLEIEQDIDCSYVVVTNPPWGIRLTEDIADSWEGLRHFIRDKCPDGTQVFVLSGDKAATATLKLRRDRMIPLQTGEQNLRWIQYTIGGKDASADSIGHISDARYTVRKRKDEKTIPITKTTTSGQNEWL